MKKARLHELKKQWIAEGYRVGMKDIKSGKVEQVNEVAPIIAAAARVAGPALVRGAAALGRNALKALTPAIKQAFTKVLPQLLKKNAPKLAAQVSKTAGNKAAASKGAFKKLMYQALEQVPVEELVNMTADKISEYASKPINSELSKADGYVAPSDKEVQSMLDEYKNSKGKS